MNPHDAFLLVEKLGEYFKDIAPTERSLVQTILEKYPLHTAEVVVSQYAQMTATFDRGKLHTLLREEHNRRTPFASPTPVWRNEKDVEAKVIAEVLNKIPKARIDKMLDDLRQKSPDVFRLMKADPMQTDIGRSLIYNELKNQQRKSGAIMRST